MIVTKGNSNVYKTKPNFIVEIVNFIKNKIRCNSKFLCLTKNVPLLFTDEEWNRKCLKLFYRVVRKVISLFPNRGLVFFQPTSLLSCLLLYTFTDDIARFDCEKVCLILYSNFCLEPYLIWKFESSIFETLYFFTIDKVKMKSTKKIILWIWRRHIDRVLKLVSKFSLWRFWCWRCTTF